eukprot:gene1934-3583_t
MEGPAAGPLRRIVPRTQRLHSADCLAAACPNPACRRTVWRSARAQHPCLRRGDDWRQQGVP